MPGTQESLYAEIPEEKDFNSISLVDSVEQLVGLIQNISHKLSKKEIVEIDKLSLKCLENCKASTREYDSVNFNHQDVQHVYEYEDQDCACADDEKCVVQKLSKSPIHKKINTNKKGKSPTKTSTKTLSPTKRSTGKRKCVKINTVGRKQHSPKKTIIKNNDNETFEF